MLTYEEILNMPPEALIGWLKETFYINLIQSIITPDDLDKASELLLVLTSYYSYLAELLSYAKIAVRRAKRESTREEWEDMVDRKEIIEWRFDIVKQQYHAVSRAITARSEANKELFMS